MKITNFEDIQSWQLSRSLVIEVYKIFRSCNDYSFKDQIQRAAVSIMNNIAEGFERKSNAEFKHFLFMAKGSAGEFRSMLYLSLDLKYITDEQFESLYEKVMSITKLLSGLIKTL